MVGMKERRTPHKSRRDGIIVHKSYNRSYGASHILIKRPFNTIETRKHRIPQKRRKPFVLFCVLASPVCTGSSIRGKKSSHKSKRIPIKIFVIFEPCPFPVHKSFDYQFKILTL